MFIYMLSSGNTLKIIVIIYMLRGLIFLFYILMNVQMRMTVSSLPFPLPFDLSFPSIKKKVLFMRNAWNNSDKQAKGEWIF